MLNLNLCAFVYVCVFSYRNHKIGMTKKHTTNYSAFLYAGMTHLYTIILFDFKVTGCNMLFWNLQRGYSYIMQGTPFPFLMLHWYDLFLATEAA